MASITVKNIPDDLYMEIKESAKIHERSINSEIIYRLRQCLSSRKTNPEKLVARIEAIHKDTDVPQLTDDMIKKAKEEGRL